MGNNLFKMIAHELLINLKSSISVGLSRRESAPARMSVFGKRILCRHDYPDLQDNAVQMVLRQAAILSAMWST